MVWVWILMALITGFAIGVLVGAYIGIRQAASEYADTLEHIVPRRTPGLPTNTTAASSRVTTARHRRKPFRDGDAHQQ